MDHEVELAVVIGKTATGVKRTKANDYIAGYTICNDVTARSMQTEDINRRYPWFRTKSLDTFTPLGPWIVTTDAIRQPVRLDIECRVNGKVRQHSNTRHLLFDIPTDHRIHQQAHHAGAGRRHLHGNAGRDRTDRAR